MFATYCAGWSLMLRTRSSDHFTSSADIGLPLANLTFSRIVKRQPLPSGVRSHFVASIGLRLM